MNARQGELLLALARAWLAEAFGGPRVRQPEGEPWLDAPGATFVSLHQGGDLRGCVGNLRPRSSLYESVVHNARAAAFDDSRFAPLDSAELGRTQLEVTVLSPLETIPSRTEAEAIANLTPGTHGVVLSCDGRSGVFIPQMWEQLPEPREFLFHLKRKAGLPTQVWPDGMRVERFTAEHWEEAAP